MWGGWVLGLAAHLSGALAEPRSTVRAVQGGCVGYPTWVDALFGAPGYRVFDIIHVVGSVPVIGQKARYVARAGEMRDFGDGRYSAYPSRVV